MSLQYSTGDEWRQDRYYGLHDDWDAGKLVMGADAVLGGFLEEAEVYVRALGDKKLFAYFFVLNIDMNIVQK